MTCWESPAHNQGSAACFVLQPSCLAFSSLGLVALRKRLQLSTRTWAVGTYQAPVINLLGMSLQQLWLLQFPLSSMFRGDPRCHWGQWCHGEDTLGLGKSPTSRTAWRLQPWHKAGQCHRLPGTAGHRASGAQTAALASLAALGNAPRELPGPHHPSTKEELGFLLCSSK